MKKFYYYLECETQNKLFSILDKNVDEGFITYKIDKMEGFIIINLIDIEKNDELFRKIEKMDLIENDYYDGDFDEDFDDFYNSDDFEDN